MEFFVKFMFWMLLGEIFVRIVLINRGTWNKPVSINNFTMNILTNAIFCIWAGFALWY